jgi:hypothetical protein
MMVTVGLALAPDVASSEPEPLLALGMTIAGATVELATLDPTSLVPSSGSGSVDVGTSASAVVVGVGEVVDVVVTGRGLVVGVVTGRGAVVVVVVVVVVDDLGVRILVVVGAAVVEGSHGTGAAVRSRHVVCADALPAKVSMPTTMTAAALACIHRFIGSPCSDHWRGPDYSRAATATPALALSNCVGGQTTTTADALPLSVGLSARNCSG